MKSGIHFATGVELNFCYFEKKMGIIVKVLELWVEYRNN